MENNRLSTPHHEVDTLALSKVLKQLCLKSFSENEGDRGITYLKAALVLGIKTFYQQQSLISLHCIELGLQQDPNVLDQCDPAVLPNKIETLRLEKNNYIEEKFFDMLKELMLYSRSISGNSKKAYICARDDQERLKHKLYDYRHSFSLYDHLEPLCLIAARLGYVHIIKWIINNQSTEDLMSEQWTVAAFFAARWGHAEVVRQFIDCGIRFDYRCPDSGMNAFLFAVNNEHSVVVEMLLKIGASVTVRNENNQTALMIACHKPNRATVISLLERGADVNAQGSYQETPLMSAVRNGHCNIVKLLLEAGAIVDLVKDNDTALTIALYYKNVEIVKLLIAHCEVLDYQSPRFLLTALMSASKDLQPEMVKALLDAGAEVSLVNEEGWNALMLAAERIYTDEPRENTEKREEVVRLLLMNNATLTVKQRSKVQKEAIALIDRMQKDLEIDSAAYTFKLSSINFFLQGDIHKGLDFAKKAVKNDPTIFNSERVIKVRSATLDEVMRINEMMPEVVVVTENTFVESEKVKLSVYYREMAIRRLNEKRLTYTLHLIEEALKHDEQTFDVQKCTIRADLIIQWLAWKASCYKSQYQLEQVKELYIANQEKYLLFCIVTTLGLKFTMRWLIEQAKKIDKIEEVSSKALIFLAAKLGQVVLVKYFIEERKMDVNRKDDIPFRGETCLMGASAAGHTELVKYLISKQADIEIANNNGETPLIYAARFDHMDIVKMLLENSANANVKTSNNSTPLLYACKNGNLEMVIALLDAGAVINTPLVDGWIALMIAAEYGFTAIVQVQVARGANVNHTEQSLWSSLMLASEYGHDKVVEILLSNNAMINHQEKSRWTALLLASEFGHRETVRKLLKAGADVHHQEQSGWTALMLAAERGHGDVVEDLLVKGAIVDTQNNEGWNALMLAALEPDHFKMVLLSKPKPVIDRRLKNGFPATQALQTNKENVIRQLLIHHASITDEQRAKLTKKSRELIDKIQQQIVDENQFHPVSDSHSRSLSRN